MEFIEIIISSIEELFLNPSLSNIVTFFLSFLLTFFFLRKDKTYEFKLETYKNFISPLFQKIEPNLYHKPNDDDILSLIDFIDLNYKYSNGKLKEYAYFCKSNLTYSSYNILCFYIDFLYDKYCLMLSINLRSVHYRIKRKQYINLLHHILLFVLFFLHCFRAPIVTYISIFLIINIAISYGKHIELFLLLILIVLIWAIIQILWDAVTSYRSTKDDPFLQNFFESYMK